MPTFRLYIIQLSFLLPLAAGAITSSAKDNEIDRQIAQLQNELIESEVATAEALAYVQDIKKQVRAQNINIKHLNERKTQYAAALARERQRLKEQIRAGYKLGHNNTIKLLLNAGDPVHIQRMLGYHGYYNRARIDRIRRINNKLQILIGLQQSIEHANETLKKLKSRYQKRLALYTSSKGHRNQQREHLQRYIQQQQRYLQVLQKNEKKLQLLLDQLHKKETATIKALPKIPSFDNLKGRLRWPLNGDLMQKFGALKKGSKLRSKGVIIKTEHGADVQAIGAGNVIFADWFGNLGLLLIIDHNHGYMSLYGHNQILLKKAGDKVSAREVVAQAGDTGGRRQAGLYFEIRKDSAPVNPAIWCLP